MREVEAISVVVRGGDWENLGADYLTTTYGPDIPTGGGDTGFRVFRGLRSPFTLGNRLADAIMHYAPKCNGCERKLATRVWGLVNTYGISQHMTCDDPECVVTHVCKRCGGEDSEPLSKDHNCQYCGGSTASTAVPHAESYQTVPFVEVLRNINAYRGS